MSGRFPIRGDNGSENGVYKQAMSFSEQNFFTNTGKFAYFFKGIYFYENKVFCYG
jgi:hypothetical protein